MEPTVWSIKQNPYQNTDQTLMRNLILREEMVTCPFGHVGEVRNNVIDGKYNETNEIGDPSLQQDRKFAEAIKIGDILVITFTGIKECILARVISDTKYLINTGLFTRLEETSGKFKIDNDGDVPFRPVGRTIQIIQSNVIFPNKKKLPIQRSLQNIDMSYDEVNRNIIRELIR